MSSPGPVVGSVTAHLVVAGADRAAAFYASAFGARELSRLTVPDGRNMSIVLVLGESRVHLADEFPEMGVLSPVSIGGTATVLQLATDDVDALWERALAAGAVARQAPTDAFWGDRHAQLEDPFGHRWNLASRIRDVPHEEQQAAVRALFTGPA